jgi:hypothetical protein
MKSLWSHTRRLSASIGSAHSGYMGLRDGNGEGAPLMLELDFVKDKEGVLGIDGMMESSVSGKSTVEVETGGEEKEVVKGFDKQVVVGGRTIPRKGSGEQQHLGKDDCVVDGGGSDSEGGADGGGLAERKPLVKA